jgi:hypothetical protein
MRGKSGRGSKLTTHLHRVSKLRTIVAVASHPDVSSRHVQGQPYLFWRLYHFTCAVTPLTESWRQSMLPCTFPPFVSTRSALSWSLAVCCVVSKDLLSRSIPSTILELSVVCSAHVLCLQNLQCFIHCAKQAFDSGATCETSLTVCFSSQVKHCALVTFRSTMRYATTNDATTNECYNKRGGILSADVARTCVWRVGPSRFD